MKIQIQFLLLISSIISSAQSLVVTDSVVASSCIYYLNQYNWDCSSKNINKLSYQCQCPNSIWLESVTNCISDISDNNTKVKKHALDHIVWQCGYNANISYTESYLEQIMVNSSQKLVITTSYGDFVKMPILTNTTAIRFYQDSFQNAVDHTKKSQWFGYILNMYWIMIFMFSVIISTFKKLVGHNWVKSGFANNDIVKYIRSSLIHKALIHEKFNESYLLLGFFPVNLPSRIQSIVLGIFWFSLIIFTIVDFHPMYPNGYINNKFYLYLDYIGYRSGILAFSVLPITFLLAIKNNPVDLLTGWSRTTSITFHKSCARAMTISGLIHSLAWLIYAIMSDQLKIRATQTPLRWALTGFVVLIFIWIQSFKIFRNLMYEIFLILHKLFAITFLIAMLGHCQFFGWLGWIYAILAIYIFDKLASIFKVFWFGGIESAMLEKFGDIVKITINKPDNYVFYAGIFNYIHFMKPFKLCWQSHPFTVNLKKSMDQYEEDKLIIIFKIKNGITKEVSKYIDNQREKIVSMPVMLEAPYGHSRPLNNHENYVFICCGLGMAAVYSHIVELADCQTPNVQLFWISRSDNVLDWFEEELQYLCDRGVSVELLVTRPASKPKESELNMETVLKSKRNTIADFYNRNSAMSVISFDSNYLYKESTYHTLDPKFEESQEMDFGIEIFDLYSPGEDFPKENHDSNYVPDLDIEYIDQTPIYNPTGTTTHKKSKSITTLEYPENLHHKTLSHASSEATLNSNSRPLTNSPKVKISRSSTLTSEKTYSNQPIPRISKIDSNVSYACASISTGKNSIETKYLIERPNLKKIVKESKFNFSTAYICCGPPKFNDSMRTIVNDEIKTSVKRIDYQEESFEW